MLDQMDQEKMGMAVWAPEVQFYKKLSIKKGENKFGLIKCDAKRVLHKKMNKVHFNQI